MDAISESRLAEVHPVLARRVRDLASQLAAEFITIRVTQGIRTTAQQNALWAQGRDTSGKVIGRTVTNAYGTQSNHVMGFAVDVVPIETDGEPIWDANNAAWKRIVELAPSHGLRDGISWKDEPHLELQEVPPEPTGEAQQTYLDAGVTSVWSELKLT